jgi:hypothetical protein
MPQKSKKIVKKNRKLFDESRQSGKKQSFLRKK